MAYDYIVTEYDSNGNVTYQGPMSQDPMISPEARANFNQAPPPGSQPAPTGAAPSGGDSGSLAAQLYPQYAWALNDPELGPILRQAAAEGWDSARLQGAIYGTGWWRNNSNTMRAATLLEQTDPRTFNQNLGQMQAHITDIATQEGIQMSPAWDGFAQNLARQAIMFGWDDASIRRAIVNNDFVGFSPTSPLVHTVREMAGAYAIKLDDGTINAWVHDLAAGRQTEENLRGWMIETAKGKYPGIANELDKGMTVGQIAAPYIQQAASELGISPNAIDIQDPKWSVPLSYWTDKGAKAMTLYDWQKYYRTHPEYGFDASPTAREQSASFVGSIAQAFGAI